MSTCKQCPLCRPVCPVGDILSLHPLLFATVPLSRARRLGPVAAPSGAALMMKWPFFNRLRMSRASSDKLESNMVKKKLPRKRYRQARLLDLLCTVRHRARLHEAPSCCSSRVSDGFSTTQEFPILGSGRLVGEKLCYPSSLGSMGDLMELHSLALRHPIPTLYRPCSGDADWRKRRPATDAIAICHPKSCRQSTTQPAFCPTCHNVVILLPQKRKSSDMTHNQQEHNNGTKRIRPCLEAYNPSYVPSTLSDHMEWSAASFAPSVTETKMESFNPTYISAEMEDDQTIYSVIADDESSLSDPDNDSETTSNSQIVDRPKLVGTRRAAKYSGTKHATLAQWLLHNSTTQEDIQSSGPTYDVIDPNLVQSDVVLDSASGLLGDPWMTSTLKRGHIHPGDDVTLYDDVASDVDDLAPAVHNNSTRSKVKLRQPRRRQNQSPTLGDDPIKRVRREYFVCEE